MSSPAFNTPLTLEIGPSRARRIGLIALHATAAAGLFAVPASWALGGAGLLAVSGGAEWRRCARRWRLRWCGDGVWEHPEGAWRERSLDRSTFVSGWLVVLALDDGRRVHRYALFRDALPSAQWRRLCVRLRVEGPARIGDRPLADEARRFVTRILPRDAGPIFFTERWRHALNRCRSSLFWDRGGTWARGRSQIPRSRLE